jgi:hypothetical protein
MMDPSETNSFEEQWKKAFQEASEMPPMSAWEGIEARLDKEERKVVPLWWQTPKLWYAAASVAALLMVGIALWNNDVAETNQEMAAHTRQMDTQQKGAAKSDIQAENKHDEQSEELNKKPTNASEAVIAAGKLPETKSEPLAAVPTGELSGKFAITNDPKVLPVEKENAVAATLVTEAQNVVSARSGNENEAVAELKLGSPVLESSGQILAEALTPIGYKDLDIYMQKRYVFFKPDVVDNRDEKAPKKKREYYAGVGLMPASFNPNVKVTSAPSAFAYANASSRSKVGESHAGNSYALQTQGGKRISKHWSVETGVSYLQGNSSYEGGGYLIDAATSRSQNVLESGLADKNSSSQGYQGLNGAAPLYIDLNKEVRNDYRYLQVPLQAGFTLNPDKKLSYSLLGGMMANFFMNNEIESASGNIVRTTASDDVYRSLNWAATTGLRLNYRLSTQWRAMLTGSYQQSLTSGFKSSETLEAHPYLYGVSWGVRYSF